VLNQCFSPFSATKPKIKLELKPKIESLVNGVLKNEMNGMEIEGKGNFFNF
jgi:hypothetical protein